MKTNRILILSLGIFLIQFGCEKKAVAPKSGNPSFRFEVHYGPNPGPTMAAGGRVNKEGGLSKTDTPASYYNMARVIVFDLSGYHVDSWSEFADSTADGQEYIREMYAWTGNRRSHAAWKGFFGGYFTILADQNLTLTEDHALGVVNGALGLNRVIVALTDGDLWVYRGEADVIGVEGEVTTVHLYMENVENWTNN